MLTEAEELAGIRLDPGSPPAVLRDQLAAQQHGAARVRELRALLLPSDEAQA